MPLLYRWIIALAGWIVPRDLRAQWRRGRETSAGRRWIEGGSRRKVEWELLRFSLESFRDAYRFQRRERDGGAVRWPARGLLLAARHPVWVVMILLALVFGPGAIWGVWNTLDSLLWKPMPFREPDRVVLVYPAGPFRGRAARRAADQVPGLAREVPVLRGAGRLPLAGIRSAGSRTDVQSPSRRVSVTANLLPLVGVQPRLGRIFPRRTTILGLRRWLCWRTTSGETLRVRQQCGRAGGGPEREAVHDRGRAPRGLLVRIPPHRDLGPAGRRAGPGSPPAADPEPRTTRRNTRAGSFHSACSTPIRCSLPAG